MTWWADRKLRMIQNNLREIDADLDMDLLITELKRYEANTLMMNAGGMFAFYPSKLSFQYVTPYLKRDLLKEAIAKTHQNGMRFIARFDFSKAHESLFEANPEWFYRTRDGREVNYHGIVHTCLNSEYQQLKSLVMIDEVISNYEVDGIFFNMFGYQHWDYSGNFYGPCYCNNCKTRFKAMYGEDLTGYDGPAHRLHKLYKQFQEQTSREVLGRIHDMVKAKRPDVAICTYHPHKVDIVRHESNTSLKREYPMWLYSASENIAAVEGSYPDKSVSNCCINAIDLNYRFTGVSKHEVEVRLYENVANGSNLDFCIIGVFDGYPDRANFEAVQKVFQFHAKHEAVFNALEPTVDVVLIKPSDGAARQEYLGLFKMFKESHIQFQVVTQDRIVSQLAVIGQAKAVILPGVQELNEEQVRGLSELRQAGIHLLATGLAVAEESGSLSELFDATCERIERNVTASYFDTSDTEVFRSLMDRSWITGGDSFADLSYANDAAVKRYLPYVEASSFGPPERAYGHKSGGRFGMGISRQGEAGAAAYYGWSPGALYYRHGFEDHKFAVTDILQLLLQNQLCVSTDAPGSIEVFLHRLAGGDHLLQLLNLSGFNGSSYSAALPLQGLNFTLHGIEDPQRAVSLRTGEELPVAATPRGAVLQLDISGRYEAIRIESKALVEKGASSQ